MYVIIDEDTGLFYEGCCNGVPEWTSFVNDAVLFDSYSSALEDAQESEDVFIVSLGNL